MRRRDAEDGHHRVADELLDGAAVRLERGAHLLEVARHDAPDRLGVDPLSAPGGVDDVAEEDGDGLARRARRARRLREGGAARVTESSALRVALAAFRTGDHATSLGTTCLLGKKRF